MFYALIQRMIFRLMKNKSVEPNLITSTEVSLENACNQNAHSKKKMEDSTMGTIIVLGVSTAICFVAFFIILTVYLKKIRHGKLQYNQKQHNLLK